MHLHILDFLSDSGSWKNLRSKKWPKMLIPLPRGKIKTAKKHQQHFKNTKYQAFFEIPICNDPMVPPGTTVGFICLDMATTNPWKRFLRFAKVTQTVHQCRRQEVMSLILGTAEKTWYIHTSQAKSLTASLPLEKWWLEEDPASFWGPFCNFQW